jgi:hypothetical protein
MMMTAARFALLFLCAALATPVVSGAAQSAAAAGLSFDGVAFMHRWSKGGQHEFTPKGEEDLTKWRTMVTINVHDSARTGEQLATVANRVLGNYQQAGKVIRTDSTPRTNTSEAEHFAVALLPDPGFLEAAFARFLVHDGRGVVVVYSKRFYGDGASHEMGAWLQNNGSEVERALMAWTGLPTHAALKALPQP